MAVTGGEAGEKGGGKREESEVGQVRRSLPTCSSSRLVSLPSASCARCHPTSLVLLTPRTSPSRAPRELLAALSTSLPSTAIEAYLLIPASLTACLLPAVFRGRPSPHELAAATRHRRLVGGKHRLVCQQRYCFFGLDRKVRQAQTGAPDE